MRLGPNWEQNILKVRKRISTLTDLKVPFLACNHVFYKPELAKGTPWNWILKILKYKNEILKRIELKKKMRKRGHLPLRSLPELQSLKYQNWLIFNILCWWQQKVSHSPGKIFKYIWKMLFSSSENIMDYWNLSYH